MNRNATIVAAALAGGCCVLLAKACAVSAQPVPTHVAARLAMGSSSRASFVGQDLSPATVLARVVVKEVGFEHPEALGAIADVLLRVGRGDVVRGARIYSPRAFFPEYLRERAYLAYLRSDGDQPARWPATMSWARWRSSWLALVELARHHLGNGAKGCPEQPDHFGGPRGIDHARATARGWRRLPCGGERIAMWVVR